MVTSQTATRPVAPDRRLRWTLSVALFWISAACAGATQGTPALAPLFEARPNQLVAETERFTFYSRLRFNLHDRLVRWAEHPESTSTCIDHLDPALRRDWMEAVIAFHQLSAPALGKGTLRIRFHLIDPALDLDGPFGPMPSWYEEALRRAAPAYRACWWEEDDRRNRAWVMEMLPALRKTEAAMASKIAHAHRLDWSAGRIAVDVVPYVNFGGGNTVRGDPPHTMISTRHGARHPFEPIEVLFHEASHSIVHPRSAGSVEAMAAAARAAEKPLHRHLWHGILFFTAGDAAVEAAREILGVEYRQYMYPEGLFTRAWPELQAPLETHWQAYLDEEISLKEAARRMVASVDRDEPPSVSFLSGCWRAVQDGRIVVERWGPSMGKSMLGTSITLAGGDASFYEFLRIQVSEAGVTYYAQPKGRSPAVPFAAKTIEANRIVFENPEHDFPQRIAYERSGDRLTATINRIDGSGSSQTWDYWKIACE